MNLTHVIVSIDKSERGASRRVTHLADELAKKKIEFLKQLHIACLVRLKINKFMKENVTGKNF